METIHISANAGITGFKSNKVNPGDYISYSAEALYYAKNVYKKAYVFFDENLQKEIDERKMLEEALSKAIENEEFITFYQPKVSTNANQLSGAEALIRWKHNGSLVPPDKFIPILEKNEKICLVDFWVLNQVCQDLKRWLDDGFTPMPVSVNFSRRNLGNPNLADEIVSTIERNDIPKSLIEIEITETIDEYSIDVLKNFVEKLQSKGIRAAIEKVLKLKNRLIFLSLLTVLIFRDSSLINRLKKRNLKIALLKNLIRYYRIYYRMEECYDNCSYL